MKTIGIIGGMSWESTAEYYRMMNTAVREKFGGLHSAKCLIYSVDFGELSGWLAEEDWDKIEASLVAAAKNLEKAGADFILIATNTMHKVAAAVARAVNVPLLHIAETAAEAMIAAGIKKAGLLGTRPTMEMGFYRDILAERGLEVLIPQREDRQTMHRIIFEELCLGLISDQSREQGLAVMNRLVADGAEGMILGCTELGLLFRPEDTDIPLFDTAAIHALTAVEKAWR